MVDHILKQYKTITICHPNYSPFQIMINEYSTIKEICRQIRLAWRISPKELRLFNSSGIEIFQEDLRFQPKQCKLWATLNGQELDQNIIFQEYTILDQIGQGGQGVVMLGQHKETKVYVAIKIIKGDGFNADEIDLLFRESQILKQLSHRNIVHLIQNIILNHECILVMEHLQGGSLLDLVRRKGRLDEIEARIYIRQILEGIDYCHKKNLIHRDLKLENILLVSSNSNQIKIVDFGIACNGKDRIRMGTLPYMSPELISGQSASQFSDVWAIGVILYAMLFGKLPFRGSTREELIQSINVFKYTIPQKVSNDLLDLFKQIFQYRNRITVQGILNHRWLSESNPIPTLSLLKMLQVTTAPPLKFTAKKSLSNLQQSYRKISLHKDESKTNIGNVTAKPIKIILKLRSERAKSQLLLSN
ncbi:unnamed protein product [Paramecium sonneborni]|uniref:Protein kinase domain-containing protein n=1 Tax=Paramecium sonneborni TaxID=65129 RepID=A0A8S1RDW3_9CILI|nr:unnamed protein product [Paramecium sonneborni]